MRSVQQDLFIFLTIIFSFKESYMHILVIFAKIKEQSVMKHVDKSIMTPVGGILTSYALNKI